MILRRVKAADIPEDVQGTEKTQACRTKYPSCLV